MTDIDKLKKLLTDFGVGFDVKHNDIPFHRNNEVTTSIFCEQGNNKVDGYMGFFTYFQFDKDGKFAMMGAGE